MTRDEILLFLRTNKLELFRVHGVTHIGLFGGYARQAACDNSDFDIMVELEDEKKTLRNFFSLKQYLDQFNPL